MTRTMSRWIFWLVLARLAVSLVLGEFFILSGPDVRNGDWLHRNQLSREMYCITDEITSSLVWNNNLRWSESSFKGLNDLQKPYVLPGNLNFVYPTSDNLTCQMDSTSSCSHSWSRTGNWSYVTSLVRPMSPVSDNRWQDFEEKMMPNLFEFQSSRLPAVGSLAVSIRGVRDAHLALCNQPIVHTSYCYFVILGGWNNTKSVIRQCKSGIPDPVTKLPEGDCMVTRAEHFEAVLSPTEWKTFVLKWNFQGKTEITVHDSSKELLKFSSRESDFARSPLYQSFIFARSSEPMFMKFHTYGYSLTTSTQSKLTSPRVMTSSSSGNICIEMSISLCESCQMILDFIDSANQTIPGRVFKGKTANGVDGLPVWHNVKLNKTKRMQQPIRLSINTLFTDTTSDNPYWAVSNIRRCYDGELKLVKMTAYQDYRDGYFWPNVTCQKISTSGTTLIDSTNRNFTTSWLEYRTLCTEGKIGESCSVSCSKLFSSHKDCNSLQACDVNGCSCAPGYRKDSFCTNHCTDHTFGYECKRKCGNCTDRSCSFATGECKLGCESDRNNLYLPPYCKKGISSPPPPNVDVLNSTCVRLHFEMKLNYLDTPTNVTFEIWENSTEPFFVSHPINIKRTTSIEVYVERLKPGTNYKSIGIINARNKTLRGEWGNFTTPCTESPALGFYVHVEETSVTIDNIVDRHLNDSCPYTWYNVQFISSKQMIFDNYTNYPKTFTELEPYTDYKVTIKSHKSPILNKIVKTLEGVPGPVKNFEIVRSSHDEITFTWQPPEVRRGVIINYTAEIQLTESLGCRDFNLSNSNKNLIKAQSMITNVSQSIFTYKFRGLKPYSRYLIQMRASNLRHHGDKANLTHATSPTDTPTEGFANLRLTNETSALIAGNLRWDPPKDCSSITGPIRAAKLFIRKSNVTITAKKTDKYFFPLEKSQFNGLETYEVDLHVLRGMGDMENETNFAHLTFEMPPRAPPPVRNFEIIEVDPINQKTTLRWKIPEAPLQGKLQYYSIGFCNIKFKSCYIHRNFTTFNNEFCGASDKTTVFCKTITLPPAEFEKIQIRAHNEKVANGSEPKNLALKRKDFEPYAPASLNFDPQSEGSSEVRISWSHPDVTGGRLQRFDVEASVKASILKSPPWTATKTLQLILTRYEPWYKMNLSLYPSTTFKISVKAVTTTGLMGDAVSNEITIPDSMKFKSKDLKPDTSEDHKIRIKIPDIINDTESSAVVVLVQGERHCDNTQNYTQNVDISLFAINSTSRDKVWKVVTITNLSSLTDNEFIIGDGQVYGNTKNYELCPGESYGVHVFIVNNETGIPYDKSEAPNNYIHEIVRTNERHFEVIDKSVAFTSWVIPLCVLVTLIILLIFIIYRRKSPSDYLKTKNATNHQENMPLSNDYQDKNSNNKVVEKFQLVSTTNSSAIDKANNILDHGDNTKKFTMPVKVEEFDEYFESAYKSGKLKIEYLALKSGLTKPHSYGSQPEMKPKNRYFSLFPYDDTRVILKKLPDDPNSDYINASYVKGYNGREKAYIATQGPKPNTIVDFWRMIWQEKVQIICMMSNLVENGKIKCEQYWPSEVGQTLNYGKVSVQFTSEQVHNDYTYRTLVISCPDQEPRSVEQLHYTAWPDHGVPSNPRSIVAFLKEIQRHAPIPRNEDSPPMVVHCSAGVGRTGTLIVLDMAICRVTSERVIDVNSLVLSAREDRLNMVHNLDQYLLVHLVLVEYLNSEDTSFPCDQNLPKIITEAKTKSQFYFQRILDTSWWNEVLGSPPLPEKSVSNKNRMKHRFPDTAGSVNRLYLKRSMVTDEDSDYIAATRVKGIFKDCQYITTQLPMPTTLGDFWRMISEQNVELVLVLQQPDLQDSTYCDFVPENQGFASTNFLKIIRQPNSTTVSQYYFKEEVMIIDSSEQPKKDQAVKIINYKNWPCNDSLPPPEELVGFWRSLKTYNWTPSIPIVVVCRDGVTASGIWLTMSLLLSKMSRDNECDVPQAVREIRRCRKEFLKQPEHLSYLYDLALAWTADKS